MIEHRSSPLSSHMTTMFKKLGGILFTKNAHHYSRTNPASRQQFKKRHWVLGSLVIMMGSWLTHTTTAMITDTSVNRDLASEQWVATDVTNIDNADQILTEPDLLTSANIPTNNIAITPQKPEYKSVTHNVKKGESLGIIFKKLGFDLSLPYRISKHDTAKKLVSLSIGKTLIFKLDDRDVLREIHYPSSALENLVVYLDDKQISQAQLEEVPHLKKQRTISGEISSSLYESALASGLSVTNIMEMVRIFGWDIDFVLDIRAGDHFHVVYEDYIADNGSGDKLTDGNILAAEFTSQGKSYRAIRFENQGIASYFTPQGESMLGTFLRSPVEFSRISSRFGKRKHPILKKWRAHKGVDYAASRRTPIRATADGKVIHAGRKGGYGNTIVLRHAGRFTTLYAHMSGFAKGVRSGRQVKQGDVIGYIGSTGLATGPHLHYEFRLDGVHRNPLTYKTPKASAVAAEQRTEFDAIAQNWNTFLDQQQKDYMLAKLANGQAEL